MWTITRFLYSSVPPWLIGFFMMAMYFINPKHLASNGAFSILCGIQWNSVIHIFNASVRQIRSCKHMKHRRNAFVEFQTFMNFLSALSRIFAYLVFLIHSVFCLEHILSDILVLDSETESFCFFRICLLYIYGVCCLVCLFVLLNGYTITCLIRNCISIQSWIYTSCTSIIIMNSNNHRIVLPYVSCHTLYYLCCAVWSMICCFNFSVSFCMIKNGTVFHSAFSLCRFNKIGLVEVRCCSSSRARSSL